MNLLDQTGVWVVVCFDTNETEDNWKELPTGNSRTVHFFGTYGEALTKAEEFIRRYPSYRVVVMQAFSDKVCQFGITIENVAPVPTTDPVLGKVVPHRRGRRLQLEDV